VLDLIKGLEKDGVEFYSDEQEVVKQLEEIVTN
jgi:hypothetical protein